jgi:hypothetical protein
MAIPVGLAFLRLRLGPSSSWRHDGFLRRATPIAIRARNCLANIRNIRYTYSCSQNRERRLVRRHPGEGYEGALETFGVRGAAGDPVSHHGAEWGEERKTHCQRTGEIRIIHDEGPDGHPCAGGGPLQPWPPCLRSPGGGLLSRRRQSASSIGPSLRPIVRRGAALLIAHRRLAAKTIAVPPTLCHERASPKISRPRNAMSISIGIRCLS